MSKYDDAYHILENARKEEWDNAPRIPHPVDYYNKTHSRTRKLYDVLEGQFFQRNQDGMVVRIDFVSQARLVLVTDVCTKTVYRCYEVDFNTFEVKWHALASKWADDKLVWTRIGRDEAKKVRREYLSKVSPVHRVLNLISFWNWNWR